jgi:hypothetical protein
MALTLSSALNAVATGSVVSFPLNPITGQIYANPYGAGYYVYNGSAWLATGDTIGTLAAPITSTPATTSIPRLASALAVPNTRSSVTTTVVSPLKFDLLASTSVKNFTTVDTSPLASYLGASNSTAVVPVATVPKASDFRTVTSKVLTERQASIDAIVANQFSELFATIAKSANAGLYSVTVVFTTSQYNQIKDSLERNGYTINATGAPNYVISWEYAIGRISGSIGG